MPVDVLAALADERLLGATFSAPTWGPWKAFLAAAFALPMTPEQVATFRAHTGRTAPPSGAPRECYAIVGRRGGKSRIAAAVGVFLACFRDYGNVLAPGERGTLALIASDRKQARTLMRYVTGLIDGSPLVARMVANRTAEGIDLTNHVTIEIHTASYRSIRGYTVVGAVCEELAFWRGDATANPDREIVAALRPAMATVPGALLLGISSPYARSGVLWQAFKDHHGRDGDPVLVWRADSRSMNPTIDAGVIADAYAQDASAAAAEYGAEFRRDLESFVLREAVEAVTVRGRLELPPVEGTAYVAFCDPSGGSHDSMTLAVAHQEMRGDRPVAVLDCVRERRAPFSPEQVVEEFADVLRQYRVAFVRADAYAAEWVREPFRQQGVGVARSKLSKGEIYGHLLPLVNSKRVELLDDPRLAAQLLGLERRASFGGRESIDHPIGGRDDVVNAASGALVFALRHAPAVGRGEIQRQSIMRLSIVRGSIAR